MNPIARAPSESFPERQPVLFVLRIFLGVQSVIFAAAGFAFLGHDSPNHAAPSVWVMLAMSGSLGISTALPVARSRWFLSTAFAITLLLPAVGQALALRQGPAAFEKMSIELAFLFVVPLVLVAWTYSFRVVVGLALGLALVEAVILCFSPLGVEGRELLGHLLVDRTLVLIIVGYVVSSLVGAQCRQHAALEEAHQRLRRSAAGLEQLSISRERNRMARELHDTLAHTLTAITVQLEAANTESKRDPGRAEAMVRSAGETARAGLFEVRRALRELRASPIEDLGLVMSIRTLAEQHRERTRATVDLRLPEATLSLPSEVEQGLYRIVQESLSNVERHAGARAVALELDVDDSRLVLRVTDDGCGFDPTTVPPDRYGLTGLRERASLLGARLMLRSSPGQGSSVELELTLPSCAREGFEGLP